MMASTEKKSPELHMVKDISNNKITVPKFIELNKNPYAHSTICVKRTLTLDSKSLYTNK
jgi:hypothetical protein